MEYELKTGPQGHIYLPKLIRKTLGKNLKLLRDHLDGNRVAVVQGIPEQIQVLRRKQRFSLFHDQLLLFLKKVT